MALQAGCGSGSAPTHQRLCGDGKGVRFEDEKCEEESMRAHLRETAAQAGIETFGLSIEELGPVTRTAPGYLDGPRDLRRHVKKPRLGREGANVAVVDGADSEIQQGDYGAEGFVWQAIADLPERHAVIGSWLIDQTPAGIGFREPPAGRRITTNRGRFVPHRLV